MLLTRVHLRHQPSDALLELAVLGGVDERVDEAVCEHHHRCDVVIPASEVGIIGDEADNNQGVVWCEANDESATHNQ